MKCEPWTFMVDVDVVDYGSVLLTEEYFFLCTFFS